MTVFDNLVSLIGEADGAVLDFNTKVSALVAPLGDEVPDGEEGEVITLEMYIRSIIEAYLAEGENSEDGAENPKLGIGGKPTKEINPLEQLSLTIAELKSEVKGLPNYGVINKLQAQVASLPSKEDIVSSVLARVPEPNCKCKKDELNRPLGGGGGSDIITTTSDQLSGGG